ncbi:MAG: hypothetical protein HFG72_10650 [Hungatella sp.]|jgi:predicted ribosomally synthesized peptide with SipW-like signal peptide|nr:hypothetical protein [Hungatella sp.]
MERSKTTFQNRAKLLAAICLLALLSLGGTMAYMTDHESAENRFTVGKVDFNLYERNWDGERPDGTYATSSNATSSNATSSNALGMEQAENMYAGMEINKDPAIKNNSKNDAYLRMTVKVPVATVSTADRDGNLVDGGIQKETELFSYELNPYCGMKPVSYWPTVENGFHVYEYMYTGDGYHEIPVPAGHNIPPLFHTVTFANVVDGEINEETEFIYVDFKAIQSGGFDTPEDAWRAYDNQSQ